MPFLLNIVALLLVLAVCIAGIGWLHERAGRTSFRRRTPGTCPTCEGVGAVRRLADLHPCPDCQGTGVGSGASDPPPGRP